MRSKTNTEETFDVTEKLRDLNKNNGTRTSGDQKRELEQSLERATETQNTLNKLVQGLNHELELSQNFFFDENVNCSQQQQQQQQHFIPIKKIRRCSLHRKKKI